MSAVSVRRGLSWSVAVIAALVAFGAAGCGADQRQSATLGADGGQLEGVTGTITVAAAASLSVAFKQIGDAFESAHPGVEVTFNFDSSSALAAQIVEGAPVDVFASADEASMATLVDKHLLAGQPEMFAGNQMVIVTKPGNPEHIAALSDLAGLGDSSVVSLCVESAPCGQYAAEVLGRAKVAIAERRISRGQNVAATLTAVSEGDAVAGIVYASDAAGAGAAVETVTIPTAQNVTADYPIGVLARSSDPAAADEFRSFVLGSEGQRVLRNNTFLPAS